MNRYDVLIIGSGLSGLLCGYILSKEGFSVCILEKQSVAGGCLQSFRRGENSFDTGFHYIGSMLPGQTLHSYWKYFGLSQKLGLEQLNSDCYDLVSIEGEDYPLAQGLQNFAGRLTDSFPSSADFLDKYVNALSETVSAFPLYNFELKGRQAKTVWMETNAWEFLRNMAGKDPGNLKLLNVLAGNNFLYAGRKAYTPWHQYALINHSFISSAFRMKQSSMEIADHLISSVKSAGGKVFTGQEATKIIALKEKFQVETSAREVFVTDRIIAGIHPQSAIRLLDPSMVKKTYRSRIMGMHNTVSSFGLYLGMKPGSFPYLDHNLYYHLNKDVWADAESKNENWPSMYFLYTPANSRQGSHSSAVCILSYMVYEEVEQWEKTSTGRRGKDYREFKNERAEKLLSVIERKFPFIRSSISNMEISTPLTWRDYTGTPEGSLYGIRKESDDHLRTMILPRTKIPGFYFTGQNLNMHGAPGVTIGAVMTCAEILGLEYLFNKIRNA